MSCRTPTRLLLELYRSSNSSSRARWRLAPLLSEMEVPFLYHTRTLSTSPVFLGLFDDAYTLEPSIKPRAFSFRKIDSEKRAYSPHHQDRSIQPSRHLPETSELKAEQRETMGVVPRRRRDSTITPTERDTFSRIFTEIVTSYHQPRPADAMTPGVSNASQKVVRADGQPLLTLTGNAYLDTIFNEAVKKAQKKEKRKEKERKKDVSFGPDEDEPPFPPAVRLARATSIRSSPSRSTASPGMPIPEPIAAAEVRLPELKRMEDLLRSAQTDVSLWSILETEVFPMIRTLGTPHQTPPTTDGDITYDLTNESDKLTRLASVCSNYPYLLLVAFRLLAHEFDSPATCRALFAHIKALGPVSLVLGVSKALYHEMIDLTWRAYRDPAAVADLLHDMDRGGLELDQETDRILGNILHDQSISSTGSLATQEISRPVWEMDAFRSGMAQVAEWRNLVKERVEEKSTSQFS